MNPDIVILNGDDLSVAELALIANGAQVQVTSWAQMAHSNALVRAAANDGVPVYGVTTGLGPKVVQTLSTDEIAAFSMATLRGRAHAIGPSLTRPVVRAAMAVRLNTWLKGASGADPAVGQHLLACLNADLVPYVGSTTSIGAADLMWGATMGLALWGEGRFLDHENGASEVLQTTGLTPPTLGPRDGLALASHSSFTTALAALGLHRARAVLRAGQVACALSMEGFRANTTPFRADILALNNQPGAAEAGAALRDVLAGSDLLKPGAARRLQDPLSLRNAVQVQGSVLATLGTLNAALTKELNGSSDSPAVLSETREIASSGNFLNPYLDVVLGAANRAILQMAAQTASRIQRMLANRFTDLSDGLNDAAAGNAGLGPVTKISEALFAEIAQAATPAPVYPSSSADGVEDTICYAAVSGKALDQICSYMEKMIAIELIIAAQATEMRPQSEKIASDLRDVLQGIRATIPPQKDDRSLGAEIELLAGRLYAITG